MVQPDPNPGRYCCLHPDCDHPREQVFNGGGDDMIAAHLRTSDWPAWLPTPEFVARLNSAGFRRGKPWIGMLHPLAMLLWDQQQKAAMVKPSDMIRITGI